MAKALPQGLAYADIKPQGITSMLRLVQFTPTATATAVQPGTPIRFNINSTGFYDPYSAFLQIDVSSPFIEQCEILSGTPEWKKRAGNQAQMQFLDQSGHSLIRSAVFRSLGTEIERIEEYDTLATHFDLIYSDEQRQAHANEGYGYQKPMPNNNRAFGGDVVNDGFSDAGGFQGGAVGTAYYPAGVYGVKDANRLSNVTGVEPAKPKDAREWRYWPNLAPDVASVGMPRTQRGDPIFSATEDAQAADISIDTVLPALSNALLTTGAETDGVQRTNFYASPNVFQVDTLQNVGTVGQLSLNNPMSWGMPPNYGKNAEPGWITGQKKLFYDANWPTSRQMEFADGARCFPGRGDGAGDASSSFFDVTAADAHMNLDSWDNAISAIPALGNHSVDHLFFNSESFSGDNAHGTIPQGFWFDTVRAPPTASEWRTEAYNDPNYALETAGSAYDANGTITTARFTNALKQPQASGANAKSFGHCAAHPNVGRSVEGALTVQNGQVKRLSLKKDMTLTLPILSGFFGVLMPADAVKYIPLSAFPNLEIEFMLNEYAFFSYFTEHARNMVTAGNADPRSYQVNKFVINCNLLFFQPEITAALEGIIARDGLLIQSRSFMLAPITTIPSRVIPTTIQVNIGLKSVNAMFMCFHYTEYKTRPDLRKHDKVSHNLTSMQMKIGTDYYPSQPITVTQGGTVGKHTPFIMETFKAAGKMHATDADIGISPPSFCIDDTFSHIAGWEDIAPIGATNQLQKMADPKGKRSALLRECVFSTYIYDAGTRPNLNNVLNPQQRAYPLVNTNIKHMTTSALEERLRTNRATQGVGEGQGQFVPFVTAERTLPEGSYSTVQALPDPSHVYKAQRALAHFGHNKKALSSYMEYLSRCGHCVYGLNLQNLSSDSGTISGTNTILNRPFDIMLQSPGKSIDRPSECIIHLSYDVVCFIRPDLNIKIIGV